MRKRKSTEDQMFEEWLFESGRAEDSDSTLAELKCQYKKEWEKYKSDMRSIEEGSAKINGDK